MACVRDRITKRSRTSLCDFVRQTSEYPGRLLSLVYVFTMCCKPIFVFQVDLILPIVV